MPSANSLPRQAPPSSAPPPQRSSSSGGQQSSSSGSGGGSKVDPRDQEKVSCMPYMDKYVLYSNRYKLCGISLR